MKLSEIASIFNTSIQGPEIDIQSIETDTRTLTANSLFVALKGENFDGHDFIQEAEEKGAKAILASRSISTKLPVIQTNNTLEALTQLAKTYRKRFTLPMVGLTGSCGKTTTKTLLAKIFEQSARTLSTEGTLNNHIGVPLTLMKLRPMHQYAVIEMGANHPGEIKHLTHIVRPTTALITNIAPVHLSGFKNIEGVAYAKEEIFQGLDKDGIAILNTDEPYAKRWSEINKGRKILTFGLNNPADITARQLNLTSNSKASFILKTPQGDISIQLKLSGEHQVMNALAASAAAFAQHISLEQIKLGLESVNEVNHRMSYYTTSRGIHIIDDSYNANPTSTLAALTVLKKAKTRKIFIFADMLELGEYAESYHEKIGNAAKEMGIDILYGYGTLSKFAVKAFGKNGVHFKDKKKLIASLEKEIASQTTLLVKGSNSMKMWEVVHALNIKHS